MTKTRAADPILRAVVRPSASARWSGRIGGAASRTSVRWKSGPYGYTQAKALVFSEYGEPKDVLKLHTYSISPDLPAGSVLLRTLAAPINPADVNTIQGTYGAKPTFSSLIGTGAPSAVGGNEGVFEVVSSSSSSSNLEKGDWVIPAKTGFGTWRTHAVAPADTLIKIDDKRGITPVQAATVAVNPCSAYRLLRDHVTPPLREGDWFIQNGANGGVGRAAIQLGRRWGYRSINIIRGREGSGEGDEDGEAATRALADELRALGADHVVTEKEFLSRDFRARLAEWTRDTGGAGVRLGLNCVGGQSAQAVAASLGTGGTMVTYGGMSRRPVSLPTGLLIFKDVRFVGFWLSRWADANPDAKARTVAEILDLARAGAFREAPLAPVPWDWETPPETLSDAVQGTLQGFRAGKGVFVFGET
ncbi:hypothetical protein F5Y14DRAFT_448877 [Nemania sp. NC0429]|nr:hypothetical protein F5Y14DRAFT_448877 [Nemania sp. NC0429]